MTPNGVDFSFLFLFFQKPLWCCRSASGQALTGHHKLDRSISGPLSMGGSGTGSGGGGGGGGGGGNKQQQRDDFSADDLAGPTVAAQDEDGLSESEVSRDVSKIV